MAIFRQKVPFSVRYLQPFVARYPVEARERGWGPSVDGGTVVGTVRRLATDAVIAKWTVLPLQMFFVRNQLREKKYLGENTLRQSRFLGSRCRAEHLHSGLIRRRWWM